VFRERVSERELVVEREKKIKLYLSTKLPKPCRKIMHICILHPMSARIYAFVVIM